MTHDAVGKLVTLQDGSGSLALRLRYDDRCVLDRLVVRGRSVLRTGSGVLSAARVGSEWLSTMPGIRGPEVDVHGNRVVVRNVEVGSGGIRETWRFVVESDRIVWEIARMHPGDGVMEDACMPVWFFGHMETWTGALLDHGGVFLSRYLETPHATYVSHAGRVTFWHRETGDALRISAAAHPGQYVAVRFSRQPDHSLGFAHVVSPEPLRPRYGLRRFAGNRQDLWGPFRVRREPLRVSLTLQALDYDQEYGRGRFVGIDEQRVRELLNTVARYGVIDDSIIGTNGWRTGWACLNEPWLGQIALALGDPDYTTNLAATLDRIRDQALRPDGRVLGRWKHDPGDAMAGTYDPETGFYEAQWGHTLDSQPSYVIGVAETFDLTGDLGWLERHKDACERALEYLLRRDSDRDGLVEMLTDSHTQQQCSDWIDAVWASHENGLVNVELYHALIRWSDLEILLGDRARAGRYRVAARRLKAGFNRSLAAGGLWNPRRGWYVHWRDRDGSAHGDNLVSAVNLCAIAYGVCDDAARVERILLQIESRMDREGLFHWPLCFLPYRRGEIADRWLRFPSYENGDIFLSWGEAGVRAFAARDPDVALKYVRRVLERHQVDGLSYQRYSRRSQEGQGYDILAGNAMAVVGLYRDLFGIQPKHDRLWLEPRLPRALAGTSVRYWLRGQWHRIDLASGASRASVAGFSLGRAGSFGLAVAGDTLEFFNAARGAPAMRLVRSRDAPLSVEVLAWPDRRSSVRRWSISSPAAEVLARHTVHGLEPGGSYVLRRSGGREKPVLADREGRMEISSKLARGGAERLELVPAARRPRR